MPSQLRLHQTVVAGPTYAVYAGDLVAWLLAARHVHSLLHRLAPQAVRRPGHVAAAHSLRGHTCVAYLPAAQASQESTDSLCADQTGFQLQELQVCQAAPNQPSSGTLINVASTATFAGCCLNAAPRIMHA